MHPRERAQAKQSGNRIDELMRRRDLTTKDLARACGVSTQTAWNWRYGKFTPKGRRLETIAKVLRVFPEYLRNGKSSKRATHPPTIQPIIFDATVTIQAGETITIRPFDATITITPKA